MVEVERKRIHVASTSQVLDRSKLKVFNLSLEGQLDRDLRLQVEGQQDSIQAMSTCSQAWA